MSYEDTIADDLKRAKEILAKGKMTEKDAEAFPDVIRKKVIETSGNICGADIYPAYRLLESLVKEVERLQSREQELDERCKAQYTNLATIREMADNATGIKRDQNDERPAGAIGAVQHLVVKFVELKAYKADTEQRLDSLEQKLDVYLAAKRDVPYAVNIKADG